MIEYAGVADIARWCDVSQETVSWWIKRFPEGVPRADAVTGRNSRKYPVYGWLPEREAAWLLFAAGLRDGIVSDVVSAGGEEGAAQWLEEVGE